MTNSTTTRRHEPSRSNGAIGGTQARLIAALGVALLLGLPGRGEATNTCSTPSLAAPQDYPISSGPGGLAVGDFDGDGKQDLVVTNGTGGGVSIFLGDGLGNFGQPTILTFGGAPIFAATGHFNNDTKLDLVVADLGGQLWILLGNGDGTFGTPTSYNPGIFPVMVAVADFNEDGAADLAAVEPLANGKAVVLLGTSDGMGHGDGTFGAATPIFQGNQPSSLAVGDFDGDHHQDLAVTNEGGNTVSVLLGIGNGTFGATNSYTVGTNPTFVAAHDFDGDGLQDLAVTNVGDGTVSVLPGEAGGVFGAHVDYPVGTEPLGLAIQDFNGDGVQDLVVANHGSESVSVLLGNSGSIAFQNAVNFAVNHGPGFVAAADLNGDNLADVVVSDISDNAVSVMLNACGYPVHDTVVLPVNPLNLKIPSGKTVVTKSISVKVRNADPTHTAGYPVKLTVDDSDCGAPGTVAGTPDFVSSTPGSQNSVVVADRKMKTAKVLLTINSSAFTSFNHNAPHRCTLWFTSSAIGQLVEPLDPTPWNNSFPVELNVTNLNNADGTAVHETTIASLKPVTMTIAITKNSKAKTLSARVGNADANEPQGDSITATAMDGSCPTGTVGAVDFSSTVGIQSTTTVIGGRKKGGKLPVTINSTPCGLTQLSPPRCIATVSAIGPTGSDDKDPTNNTTRLVIDTIDKNCTP